jgi:hypothetical protein
MLQRLMGSVKLGNGGCGSRERRCGLPAANSAFAFLACRYLEYSRQASLRHGVGFGCQRAKGFEMGYPRRVGALAFLIVGSAWGSAAAQQRDYAQAWVDAECYSGQCKLFSSVPEEKAAMAKCSVMVFDKMPSYDPKYDDAVWWKYAEMFDKCVDDTYSQ